MLKFIYSEKAAKFCEIFTLLLTVCTVVKSKGKNSQNFVVFSEYMNFTDDTYSTAIFSNYLKEMQIFPNFPPSKVAISLLLTYF